MGCKKGGSSSNSPTSPSNSSKLSGGRTGTITRPNGLGTIQLTCTVGVTNSSGGDELSGTMTLSGASGSTTAAVRGVTAGNDSLGYKIYMQVSEATPPGPCKVTGNSATGGAGDPFPSPFTTITVPALTIAYVADCRGVIAGGTQQTNVNETVQLTLTKQ